MKKRERRIAARRKLEYCDWGQHKVPEGVLRRRYTFAGEARVKRTICINCLIGLARDAHALAEKHPEVAAALAPKRKSVITDPNTMRPAEL